MKKLSSIFVSVLVFLVVETFLIPVGQNCFGYTANKVRLKNEGYHYRIYVTYTDVELLKLKEAYIDFKDLKEAQECYQKLYSGADFYIKDASLIFTNRTEQEPW